MVYSLPKKKKSWKYKFIAMNNRYWGAFVLLLCFGNDVNYTCQAVVADFIQIF